MACREFDWTVVNVKDLVGRSVFSMRRSHAAAGAERLSSEAQELLLKDVAARHKCASDSRP